jgi:hypothetical protein
MNNKIINKAEFIRVCDNTGRKMPWIVEKVGLVKMNMFYKMCYIKVNGLEFGGVVNNNTDQFVKEMVDFFGVGCSIDVDMGDYEGLLSVCSVLSPRICINKKEVARLAEEKSKSVSEILKEVGINYSVYSDMSYAKIDKTGRLLPVRIPYKISKMASLLGCDIQDILVDLSKINVYENNKR